METLLALDMHDGLATGVVLEVGGRVLVVRHYGIAEIDPEQPEKALVDVIQQCGPVDGECRVAFGAQHFAFRNLNLPFGERSKIEKVLPFEIEELTAQQSEELHIDFLHVSSGPSNSRVLAATIDSNELQQKLAMLQSRGIDPEVVAVSGLQSAAYLSSLSASGGDSFVFLDIGLKRTVAVVVDGGQIRLVRSIALSTEKLADYHIDAGQWKIEGGEPEKVRYFMAALGRQLRQTLLASQNGDLVEAGGKMHVSGTVGLQSEILQALKSEFEASVHACNLADQPLLKIEPSPEMNWNPALFNRALALACWKGKGCMILNFRSGAFRKQTLVKNFRKVAKTAAVPLALVLLLLLGLSWWDFNGLKRQNEKYKQQVESVFRETLPEVTRVVNPVQQLQLKINERNELYQLGRGGEETPRQVALLSELSARIPPNLKIRISRLVADQDDVRIKGETADFNTVDNVKKELEKSDYFSSVVISSANLAPKGGEVRFELKLEYR